MMDRRGSWWSAFLAELGDVMLDGVLVAIAFLAAAFIVLVVAAFVIWVKGVKW